MKCAANNRTYKRIKERALDTTADYLSVLFAYVLVDKLGISKEQLHEVLSRVDTLTEEVIEDRVTLDDMKQMLHDEYDVIFKRR